MKQHEEWEHIGRLGEKLVALASTFQELKLALVHREIQRMADDTGQEIAFTRQKVDDLQAAYNKALKNEQEVFQFEGHDLATSYVRYLLEYLNNLFPKETAHG